MIAKEQDLVTEEIVPALNVSADHNATGNCSDSYYENLTW